MKAARFAIERDTRTYSWCLSPDAGPISPVEMDHGPDSWAAPQVTVREDRSSQLLLADTCGQEGHSVALRVPVHP